MSTETIRLVRDGKKVGGGGVWRWEKREIIYTYQYTLSPPEWRWGEDGGLYIYIAKLSAPE